jgi:putative heme transporter
MKDSYDIALGGSAAMRLLPTAGLGGAAVTIWALRARGVRGGEIGERLLAFMLLIYAVYMSAMLAAGAAVGSGLVPVSTGRSLGILGAAVAIAVTATVLILFAAPARLAGALGATTGRRSARLRSAGAQLPVLRAALQRAWLELRRAHPALLGAVAWWAFDLGVLVTMLRAFGVKLPIVAVVLAYFLGTLLNVVPVPGSLSGGLAGFLIALGSPVGGAIAAVLAYRAIAVWLPAVPGLVSLGSLRKSVAAWRAADVAVAAPTDARSAYRPFASRRRQCVHRFGQFQEATNVAN